MSVFDDFDRLLANFNDLEERLFLRDIRNFAERHHNVVVKTYIVLLRDHDLNIQLKYLILKSMGELKDKEFVPVLRDVLKKEKRAQIIHEAVNTLALMDSLPAYKVIVDFFVKHKDEDFAEKVEKSLKAFFTKNHLVFHFDVFYRNRGNLNGIDKSCDFLIKHLPEDFIQDILPSLTSRYYNIRFQLLRLLKSRPKSLYYSAVFNYFNGYYEKADNEMFLLMSETMAICASKSKARQKIFDKLKEFITKLEGEKKVLFCIAMLELDTRHMIPYITGIYPALHFDRKMLIFDKLDTGDFIYYMDFMRQLLDHEPNERVLERVVEILVRSNDFTFLFQVVDSEKGLRQEKLLNMILEHDPLEIDTYVRRYVSPNIDNQMMRFSLEYLLRHAADEYYDLIKSVFFSGVGADIKTLIIRSVNRWNPVNQKAFMELIFQDIPLVNPFKKDFLFALLTVMNERVFSEEFEGRILSQILVMMEEAALDEVVNFVYFFDRYDISRPEDSQLIMDELRLIQNTLLKSSREDDLVRMIHVLIKKIERNMKLKKRQ